MQSIKKLSLMFIIGVSILFIPDQSVHAHRVDIPDGQAFDFDENGRRTDYSPEDVNETVKNMWDNGKIIPDKESPDGKIKFIRGGKDPAFFVREKGNKLSYDVYTQKSNIQVKNLFGGRPHLIFEGWAINDGYHHHYAENQATYIGLVNKNDPTDKRIFKAAMINRKGDLGQEMHYRKGSYSNPYVVICEPDEYAKRGSECNMEYEYTQFRAYIPLDRIYADFTDVGEEWEFYIIKRVENHILYDRLIIPLDVLETEWNGGILTLESGEDAKYVTAISRNMIRRFPPLNNNYTHPREIYGDETNYYRYFAPGEVYEAVRTDESNGIIKKIQVKDDIPRVVNDRLYKPSHKEPWSPSLFWFFNGHTATLKHTKYAEVTVKHIDSETDKLLDEETKEVLVGTELDIKPKDKGYFTDEDGFEYVPLPNQRFNEILEEDTVIEFKYKVPKATVIIKHIDDKTDETILKETEDVRIGELFETSPREDLTDKNGYEYIPLPKQGFSEVLNDDTEIEFRYKLSEAVITIEHIDDKTGEVLDKETVETPRYEEFEISPKPKGFFKDKDGNDYIAVPKDQKFNELVEDNTNITFYYKAIVPDPSEVVEIEDGTEGRAEGEFNWKLMKQNDDETSVVEVKNKAEVTGEHFATRDLTYRTSSEGVFNALRNQSHSRIINNPNNLKDKKIEYSFQYTYTNHYKDVYVCVDKIEGYGEKYCAEWKFDKRIPSWEHSETVRWEKELAVDHSYGETFEFDKESPTNIELVIGRAFSWDGDSDTSSVSEDVFVEEFEVDRKDTKLESQTWKEVSEKVKYDSNLSNSLYVIEGDKYYFPYDIDKNLREKYQNNTSFSDYGKYAIPLRVGQLSNDEVEFLTEDNFFVTKNTGFQFSLPHDEVSHIVIENKAKEEYESYTGHTYDDEVLTDPFNASRYYLNIDLDSEQKPNVEYDDNVVLGKLGLNDITVHLIQTLEFENYLFGHHKDEPIFVEQRTSVQGDIDYNNEITLTPKQMDELKQIEKNREGKIHSFRSTDDVDVYNKVKEVVPLD